MICQLTHCVEDLQRTVMAFPVNVYQEDAVRFFDLINGTVEELFHFIEVGRETDSLFKLQRTFLGDSQTRTDPHCHDTLHAAEVSFVCLIERISLFTYSRHQLDCFFQITDCLFVLFLRAAACFYTGIQREQDQEQCGCRNTSADKYVFSCFM